MKMTRREILVAAGMAAAGSIASRVMGQAGPGANVPGAPAAGGDGKRVGWAFMGIGKLTTGQIVPGVQNSAKSKLAGVITGHPDEKGKPLAEKFGFGQSAIYGYDDWEKIAADQSIECVYNVLPNGMHAEYTIKALKAGKHVLCEKPMANSVEECEAMIAAAKETGKKLMVAYRCHFEQYNLKAIEICKNPGALGKLRFITTDHCFHIPAGAWRLTKKLGGGGSLVDVGIYGLNATRYLTGEEPVSVTAQLIENKDDPRFAEVEEGMVWTLKFPSGVLATNTTSYNARNNNHHRLIFESGMIDMDPATGYHGTKWKATDPSVPATMPDIDQFAAQMDYLSGCVLDGKEVRDDVSGEEGLRDHKIMAAIYEAARSGKEVKLV